MRRILMSKRGEFDYPNNKSSRDSAVKKLASFYRGVEEKMQTKEQVTISDKFVKSK